MTAAQRIKLMSVWWPAAARAQGWPAADRAVRLRVLSFCVSRADWTVLEFRAALVAPDAPARELQSATELNSSDDLDAVIRTLGMLADSLTSAGEDAANGERRRWKYLVLAAVKKLPVANPLAYAAAIARDKFYEGDLDALTSEQLRQLLFTLQQRTRRAAVATVDCPF